MPTLSKGNKSGTRYRQGGGWLVCDWNGRTITKPDKRSILRTLRLEQENGCRHFSPVGEEEETDSMPAAQRQKAEDRLATLPSVVIAGVVNDTEYR